jgi:hypothetical protein
MADPPEDWLPPLHPPADDMEDVQTHWGVLPGWKARALALAEVQTIMNDAAQQDEPPHPSSLTQQKSPTLSPPCAVASITPISISAATH